MLNQQVREQESSEIKGIIFKWLVLISFGLNSMSNIFLFTAITPIWSSVAIYYNTTDYNLNWFTNCYYFGPMTIAFLINPLIMRHFGISQIMSCTLTTLGLWLLVVVGPNYQLGFLGFVLIGAGEAVYFQVPLYLSRLWFEPQERIISTFIGQYFNNLGQLLAYSISAYYFYEITDASEFALKYEKMIKTNAILSCVALTANFITLKNPDNNKDKIEIRETIWMSFYRIMSTKESIQDLFSVSSFLGLSWCYTALFGTQQYFVGQTYLDVTNVSIMFQIGQILAAAFCTWKLYKQSSSGKQQDYDKFIKLTLGIGFWSLIVEILFFNSMHVVVMGIINFFIGAGLGGLYSVLLESLMEKHFPVQELVIGTILAAVACSISLIIAMILIIPQFSEYGFQISCYFMVPSFAYITVFYKTSFKRFELEG